MVVKHCRASVSPTRKQQPLTHTSRSELIRRGKDAFLENYEGGKSVVIRGTTALLPITLLTAFVLS